MTGAPNPTREGGEGRPHAGTAGEGSEGRPEADPAQEVDAPAWARLLLVATPFLLAVAVLVGLWMLG